MKIAEYGRILQNRNYRLLFMAQFASQLGTVTGLIAFMFYILDRFSSQPIIATVTEMMYALPTLFVFFVTGVVADKFDRQKIAIYTDWINTGLSLLILIAIYIDSIVLIFVFLFLRSAVSKFFNPAQSALLQGIVPKEDYPTAIGFNQMMQSIFFLAGNGLGAAVYWGIGVEGAIIIDALSFLISGWFISRCTIEDNVRLPNGPSTMKDLSVKNVFVNFREGVSYAVRNEIVFVLLLGILILGIVNGAQSVMHIFIMKYKLAPESYEQVQILIAAFLGSGIVIGSIVSTYLSKKIALHKMIIASFLLSGIILLLQAHITIVWLYLVLHFVFGFTIPLCNVAFFGWLGQIVDPKMMGRVQGLITPLMMLTLTLMQGFIAIAFPKLIIIETVFYIAGGASIILGVFYLTTLPVLARREKEQDEVIQVKSLPS